MTKIAIVRFIWPIFFFKQKTAYDMRISDWSSDVCSSDLLEHPVPDPALCPAAEAPVHILPVADRKSVVSGKSVSVRVDLGGRRIIKKKNNQQNTHKTG